MDYFLYVDDTAFQKTGKSNTLQDEIVSMVGALVAVPNILMLNDEIVKIKQDLKNKYEKNEFHFTDMFNRTNGFEKLESLDSLAYMGAFSFLVSEFEIPIITQTITKPLLAKQKELFEIYDKIIELNGFSTKDMKRFEEYGLFLNISLATKFLKEDDENDQIVAVVCDEGIMKNGADVKLKGLLGYDLPIYFRSSENENILQLSDFCAWGLSRTKQTICKSQKTKMKPFEQCIMEIMEPIVPNFVNIDSVSTNVENGIVIDDEMKKIEEEKNQ